MHVHAQLATSDLFLIGSLTFSITKTWWQLSYRLYDIGAQSCYGDLTFYASRSVLHRGPSLFICSFFILHGRPFTRWFVD